jgi:type I restriction enzyme S subunit
VSTTKLAALPLRIAPLDEQTRIADRIDELFTDLAAGVAALERVKRNLSRYRAAVLHAAVTGRLTEAWRKEHGTPREPGPQLLERILVERRRQWEQRTLAKYERDGKHPPKNWRERYPEPSPPKLPADGSPLPGLPKGWCWANLDCLKHFSMYGPRFSSDDYVSDGVRVLRTTDFDDAGNINLATPPMLPLTDSQFEDYGLESGDLLVTRTGSLGTLAVFQGGARAIAGAFLIYYRLNQEHVDPRFAFFVLKAPAGQRELRRRGTGVGRPNLNIPSIDSIAFSLPPLAEQTAVCEAVNEKLSQIDALEAEVTRGLARASRLRQSILKAAFEGRLVPQDPTDEPASALLERIRTEAAATDSKPKPKPREKNPRKAAAR